MSQNPSPPSLLGCVIDIRCMWAWAQKRIFWSTGHFHTLFFCGSLSYSEKSFRQKIGTVGIKWNYNAGSPGARLCRLRPQARLAVKVTSLGILLPPKASLESQQVLIHGSYNRLVLTYFHWDYHTLLTLLHVRCSDTDYRAPRLPNKLIVGLTADGLMAQQQFWREECGPCQQRSIRNLPMCEWHRSQSLSQQCSAKQGRMTCQIPASKWNQYLPIKIVLKTAQNGAAKHIKTALWHIHTYQTNERKG